MADYFLIYHIPVFPAIFLQKVPVNRQKTQFLQRFFRRDPVFLRLRVRQAAYIRLLFDAVSYFRGFVYGTQVAPPAFL